MRKSLFYLLCILVSPADIFAQQNWATHVKMIDTRTGLAANIGDLIEAMEHVDVLIFGEEHDDSIAHRIQAKLYEQLLEAYTDVTLSMEMFERDAQLVLEEYLGGHITEAKLESEGKVWNNYSDYAPLVNIAKSKEQQVIAANVPTRYANLVSRKGLPALKALPKASKKYLPSLPIFTDEPIYEAKFNEAMGGHGHAMGPSVFHAQLLRDATMAESILSAWRKNKKSKIFHLTGRFHSDEYLGTVAALKRSRKNLLILTVSCFSSEDFEHPDWNAYSGLGDFIIITNPSGSNTL
jgi:uncharacterized iron-regulated protein